MGERYGGDEGAPARPRGGVVVGGGGGGGGGGCGGGRRASADTRMKRLEDWVVRLEAFIKERTAQPFKWGSQDCCLFAADAIEAITGVDLAADFRGKYSGAETAKAVL